MNTPDFGDKTGGEEVEWFNEKKGFGISLTGGKDYFFSPREEKKPTVASQSLANQSRAVWFSMSNKMR